MPYWQHSVYLYRRFRFKNEYMYDLPNTKLSYNIFCKRKIVKLIRLSGRYVCKAMWWYKLIFTLRRLWFHTIQNLVYLKKTFIIRFRFRINKQRIIVKYVNWDFTKRDVVLISWRPCACGKFKWYLPRLYNPGWYYFKKDLFFVYFV